MWKRRSLCCVEAAAQGAQLYRSSAARWMSVQGSVGLQEEGGGGIGGYTSGAFAGDYGGGGGGGGLLAASAGLSGGVGGREAIYGVRPSFRRRDSFPSLSLLCLEDQGWCP